MTLIILNHERKNIRVFVMANIQNARDRKACRNIKYVREFKIYFISAHYFRKKQAYETKKKSQHFL